ncbi:MAG: hypothetical protein V4858_01350 [Pseudomonadota bacterium]
MLHPELILMLLATGIYLYDSLVLLERNEAVVYRDLWGQWSVGFGSNGWKIGAREPYLPNPLLPHTAQFKLQWQLAGQAAVPKRGAALRDASHFSALTPFVLVAAYSLFVLLPLGFFTPLGSTMALLAIASLYGCMSLALMLVYRRRKQFGLSNRQFVALAFECMACIPLGLNLVRKLARLSPQTADLNYTATSLLPEHKVAAYRAACAIRIKDEMDCEAEDSPRMQALQAHLENFAKEEVAP